MEDLARSPYVFQVDFGLKALPTEPDVILVRGPRQYGKSTWLEGELRDTVSRYGPATAFYLNGDEIADAKTLVAEIRAVLPLFGKDASVRRLFLDEVTAIHQWERGLKRLIDAGELRQVLVVTTDSRATDLRRGVERLPGRKGRLDRTAYFFTPISFAEFSRVCGEQLGADTLVAYLLFGGCPMAAAEITARGRLPEFVIGMVQDWLRGVPDLLIEVISPSNVERARIVKRDLYARDKMSEHSARCSQNAAARHALCVRASTARVMEGGREFLTPMA